MPGLLVLEVLSSTINFVSLHRVLFAIVVLICSLSFLFVGSAPAALSVTHPHDEKRGHGDIKQSIRTTNERVKL